MGSKCFRLKESELKSRLCNRLTESLKEKKALHQLDLVSSQLHEDNNYNAFCGWLLE